MRPKDLKRLREDVFRESRREFAIRTGVSEASLGRYERGEMPIPPWLGMVCAAAVFNLPPFGVFPLELAAELRRIWTLPPEMRLAGFREEGVIERMPDP
ncbi:helix-turn-helix domain-containing protein [Oceanicella actignis]|uniref:Helix-turn-helix n=1 Tax=Oceanicella actignis TaxID=1189325 RepID=A0A1M7U2A6_9RHOB|nr:helix-turn-helix transcriptional regulator [Oceanicella actignis]SES75977.1 hypothetical protein SAMN04488119_101378 [Oceanicella actignis]SHN77078.1 hypothetical protein SAMN05216200_11444 [Oceanicella actignis]